MSYNVLQVTVVSSVYYTVWYRNGTSIAVSANPVHSQTLFPCHDAISRLRATAVDQQLAKN